MFMYIDIVIMIWVKCGFVLFGLRGERKMGLYGFQEKYGFLW